MFDVITFGSATNDIFLQLPEDENMKEAEMKTQDFFCLPLGQKLLVEDMQVFSGGGGTNVACGLSALGLKVAYLGKVGDDGAAKLVMNDLARFKVNTTLVRKDKSLATAVSFILSKKTDRTILVFRGACHFLNKQEINFGQIQKAKWFYIAPLYEKTADIFGDLVEFAKMNNMQLAVNPSIFQITREDQSFKNALAKVDILFLNQNEGEILARNPILSVEELAKTIHRICPGIIVITQGEKGALVFEGEHFFKASVYKVFVEDRTGAGDSFASGFLAGLFKENSIEYALRLAMVSSGQNISQKGAKNGLLKQSELKVLPNIDIIKERVY